MDEVIEQGQDDAAALASAMAGYNARGATPPAEVTEEQPTEQPKVEADAAATPVIEVAPADPIEKMKAELDSFKAEVKAIQQSSGDQDAVRRLHGEIGNINRTIQQMQSAPKGEAPATDEVAAALADAEEIANEFPEIGAPMVRALKALASRAAPQMQAPDIADIESHIEAKVSQIRQKDAMEALTEEHPDWQTVRETPEYKNWLSGKTPEFQQRFTTTWNPAVVAKGLTDFKDSIAAKQKKQDRLERNVAPQGVPNAGRPSTLPDEQGAWIGYNKSKRLQF